MTGRARFDQVRPVPYSCTLQCSDFAQFGSNFGDLNAGTSWGSCTRPAKNCAARHGRARHRARLRGRPVRHVPVAAAHHRRRRLDDRRDGDVRDGAHPAAARLGDGALGGRARHDGRRRLHGDGRGRVLLGRRRRPLRPPPGVRRRAAHVARLRLHVGGVAGLRRADGVAHPLRRRRRRLPPRLDDDARRERAGHRAREQHRRDVLPLHTGRVLRGPPRLAHPADPRLALARRHLRAGAPPALARPASLLPLHPAAMPSLSHPISARSRCSPPSSPSSCCSRRRRGSRRAAATRRRGGRSSASSRSTAAARARAAPTPRRRAPPARRPRQRRARRRKRRRRRRARRRTPRAGAARASARRAASSSCARCTRG